MFDKKNKHLRRNSTEPLFLPWNYAVKLVLNERGNYFWFIHKTPIKEKSPTAFECFYIWPKKAEILRIKTILDKLKVQYFN